MNNQLITMTRTEVEGTYVAYSMLDEDVVRAGIIASLELTKKIKSTEWLNMNDTAQTVLIHVEMYLNNELNALFHGTFIDLEVRRMNEGKRRYKNAAR